MNKLTWWVIALILIALAVLSYLEISDSTGSKPLYVYLLMVATFLFFIGLLIWQEKKSDVFPQVDKFSAAIVPLFILAFYFILSARKTDLSLLLGAIFGVVTLMGLAISMAVLVRMREVVTSEMALLVEATKLMKGVHKRLIFISLSLNFGYAAAIAEKKTHLLKTFEDAFENALKRLINNGNGSTEITIAFLSESDIKLFFDYKSSKLEDYRFEVKHEDEKETETGAQIYKRRSEKLIEIVTRMGQQRPDIIRRYHTCLELDSGVLKPAANPFPPLGILIADDTAIISYNISILDKDPVRLEGHITREKEQVEAIKVFSQTYLNGYT